MITSMPVSGIKLQNDHIEIKINNVTDVVRLHFLWLRDNCRCTECYSHLLNQRNVNILHIPDDIKPEIWKIIDNTLTITWNDGHKSDYKLEWLIENLNPEIIPEPILWSDPVLDAATIKISELQKESTLVKLVRSIFVYGIGFVEGVTPTVQDTEKVVTTLFPVQRTLFGDMWNFSNKLDHYDSAYTNAYIGAHNDNTYFNDAAGLQIFHLLEHTGNGGETLLVDGFRAVKDVERTNPEYVNCLKSVSIESMYIEPDKHITAFSPILHYHPNGDLKQIRFNLLDRSPRTPVPSNKIGLFYKSLKCLASKINDPNGEWWLKLKPGTVAFINNWRVLHGRASFTGAREMSGCYVAMGELLNRARILKIIR